MLSLVTLGINYVGPAWGLDTAETPRWRATLHSLGPGLREPAPAAVGVGFRYHGPPRYKHSFTQRNPSNKSTSNYCHINNMRCQLMQTYNVVFGILSPFRVLFLVDAI